MHSEDTLVPLEMTHEGLADADTLLIYAKFLTAGGAAHEGLIVYDPDLDEVFSIELFLGEARITLNRNAQDLSNLQLQRYEKLTWTSGSMVLPIRYQVAPSFLSILPGQFDLKDYSAQIAQV